VESYMTTSDEVRRDVNWWYVVLYMHDDIVYMRV
jgi:hypothetical protein